MRSRRGPAALLTLALLLGAASALSAPASAGDPVLLRARSTAVAIHGFYDHEGLFPVPFVNLSVPYAEAAFEPGPATSALGSFLWDPEAAELGTILCVLSQDRFCQFPDYPFRARATHPSSGDGERPPGLTIEEEGAPVTAGSAEQTATAAAGGAEAAAGVARLTAIPMTPQQRSAARGLSAALAGRSPGAPEPDPWLLSSRQAASRSTTTSTGDTVAADAETHLRHVALLGGLITFEEVYGRAVATAGHSGEAAAEAGVSGVRVGDLDAGLGRRGLRVSDQRLGDEEVAAVNEALGAALREAGFSISRGHHRAGHTRGRARAEAYALSLDYRRENLPEEFPEGARGADVLRVPLGFVSANAEATAAPATPNVSFDYGADLSPSAATGSLFSAPPATEALPEFDGEAAGPVPTAPEQLAQTRVVNLGVPVRSAVLVVVAAVLAAIGLTWLKVVEVLTE